MLTRRKAFTVIELLLVIGVLVILIGIVVWGLKGAGGAASAKATRTTLQNLTNMSEELNRKSKFAGFEAIYPPPPPLPGNPALPFGPEVAPGLVTSDSKNTDRFGDAVRRTCDVMNRLRSIPDNKRSLEKFPTDQILLVPPGQLNGSPHPGGTVVLDGWRNPILFVPSTGLMSVRTRQKDTYAPGNFSRGGRVIFNGEYWTAINSTSTPPGGKDWFQGVTSGDGHAFWASAGADGSFSDGDDNIYSFDQ